MQDKLTRIYKHENADGSSVTVLDAATLPDITFVIRVDRPGIAAVSVSVPEGFFANTFNRINLGDNARDLPGETRHLSDDDSASGQDEQI